MRILVTGGCGFIGSHLVEALVAESHEVTVFDNLSTGHEENLAAVRGRVRMEVGDIRDAEAVRAACRGMQAVYHEAALVSVFESVEKPEANHDINVTGTFNVLDAARRAGVGRAIQASSAAVYGNDPALPKRETLAPCPESPYGLAKLVAEQYAAVYASLYGFPVVSLRYFNVYGPRQDPRSMYSGVISRFMDCVAKGEQPTVYGDGKQTRDFVSVHDVVRANLLALRADAAAGGRVYNVGTGRQSSLLDVLAALESPAGRALRPRFEPARAGDIRDSVADIGAARRELGYEPTRTLPEGLAEMLLPAGGAARPAV